VRRIRGFLKNPVNWGHLWPPFVQLSVLNPKLMVSQTELLAPQTPSFSIFNRHGLAINCQGLSSTSHESKALHQPVQGIWHPPSACVWRPPSCNWGHRDSCAPAVSHGKSTSRPTRGCPHGHVSKTVPSRASGLLLVLAMAWAWTTSPQVSRKM